MSGREAEADSVSGSAWEGGWVGNGWAGCVDVGVSGWSDGPCEASGREGWTDGWIGGWLDVVGSAGWVCWFPGIWWMWDGRKLVILV